MATDLKSRPQLFSGDVSIVDTVPVVPLGTRAWDVNNNEYIYLLGVASTAANDWVTYNHLFATARLVASAVGNVAVAKAATVASTYGWYQIFGSASAASDAIATNVQMFIDATTARVDDSAVSGDGVYGVLSRSTDASTNIATFQLNYPFVTHTSFV